MAAARSRIVVVTWDLAHNAASSAFFLADLLRRDHEVEIIGPAFLGAEIWEPIRTGEISIRSFPGRGLPQFVDDAERFVDSVAADVIVACKPRFPTLLLAMLIKDQCGAPVILHIDDLELGLVGATEAISLDELERRRDSLDFANPAGCAWVTACEALVGDADAITVSGEQLRQRYGGTVLGQPRDETVFDPARFDRRRIRAELGYADRDRVVLFLGSPRRHKGILDLAVAIAELEDRSIKLCVIGSFNDSRLREEVAGIDRGRIKLLDYRPVHEVPRLLTIADLVCLPQNARTAFAACQTPMKLTEALAMGIPVLANETPAMAPFAEAGVIHTTAESRLSERIVELLGEPDSLRDAACRGRRFFLEHLSYAAASERLARVIAGLPASSTELPTSWARACELACLSVR